MSLTFSNLHFSTFFHESYLGHFAGEFARDGAGPLATLADHRRRLIRQLGGAPSVHAVEGESASEMGVIHEAHDESDPGQGKAMRLKRRK